MIEQPSPTDLEQQQPPAAPHTAGEPQAVSAPAEPQAEMHAAEPQAGTHAAEPQAETHAAEPQAETHAAEPQAAEPQATEPQAQAQPAAQAANDERRKRAQEAWERIVAARENGTVVEGYVKSLVKGGLLVEIDGYRGFLPASQAGSAKGSPLDGLVNTTLRLKVIDVDQQRKRAVVSQRRALQEERRNARTELLRSLKVGEEREATVVRLADFGAFVDLGGVDALIPMSELAFERVAKASDVVAPGDRLKVRILRVEENGKKIAVSRKGALPDPWRDHAQVLRNGQVVEGKVVAKEPRLQIEIAPGVIGTLGDREANPDEYEIGESVEVSVRSIDYRNRRIRLGTPHAAASFSSAGFAPLGIELKR